MKLGAVTFDTIEFASRANAVLGIRDSGKSYTATGLAEQLLDSTVVEKGIPFIAFDPAGIWRFLRVPGKGKGYPVVVVGHSGADLPLKAQTIGKIVEAALRGRVSLVIDMSGDITKADMRRIVTECVGVLMAKNKQFGLRHVFVEEAAEFVPQNVRDPVVYGAVEKLVRIGGNMGLGVTLVNPRTENLNKEVLELCDNIFLHRQKGRNSLKNLAGWFEATGNDASKELASTVSKLGTAECFVWLRDMDVPAQIKVQAKNSHHPNRRELGAPAAKSGATVDAGAFVTALKDALPEIEAEITANDPKALRTRIAELTAALKKAEQESNAVSLGDADASFADGYHSGYADGTTVVNDEWEKWLRTKTGTSVADIIDLMSGIQSSVVDLLSSLRVPPIIPEPLNSGKPAARRITVCPPPATDMSTATARALSNMAAAAAKQVRSVANGSRVLDGGELKKAERAILVAIAEWHDLGFSSPSNAQISAMSGYSATSSSFSNALGKLRSADIIKGTSLTQIGMAMAPIGNTPPTVGQLYERIYGVLGKAEKEIFALVWKYPNGLTRQEISDGTGYSLTSSSFSNALGRLRNSFEVIEYIGDMVKPRSWLFLEKR